MLSSHKTQCACSLPGGVAGRRVPTQSRAQPSQTRVVSSKAARDSTSTDLYEDLAAHAAVLQSPPLVAVRQTALGRGLVALRDIAPRTAVVTVPIANSLTITDDPLNSLSIFSDRQQRAWQEAFGDIPDALQDFLQGALCLRVLIGGGEAVASGCSCTCSCA